MLLPSSRLILLALFAAPLFLTGALYDPVVGLGVIYLFGLGAYAALDAIILPGRRQFTINRVVPDRLSLGVPMPLTYEVENCCRRRVEVRIAENLPEELSSDVPEGVRVFPGRSRGSICCRMTPLRRGQYELTGVDVRVLPAHGLFYRQFRLSLPKTVDVFPNLVEPKRYDLLVRRSLEYEQGLARRRMIGQGTEFESLRVYALGDDMSRVDWKATAKRSELVVRNFESEREQSVLIAIDVGRATAGEFEGLSRLDFLVNAGLMLAHVVLRRGDWISLVAFSDTIDSYLPPTRGVKNIERVARALYKLQPKLVESDYAAACQFLGLRNRKRSLVCLMTDVIDREAGGVIISYMGRFARRHLPLAVTLANPEVRRLAEQPLSEQPDPFSKAVAIDVLTAREEALTDMRSRGVMVLDVEPRQLTPELIKRYLRIKAMQRL